jgi:hypothetical protein
VAHAQRGTKFGHSSGLANAPECSNVYLGTLYHGVAIVPIYRSRQKSNADDDTIDAVGEGEVFDKNS